jgi:putative glycosyltransferase (TIGR04372 family)
MNALNRPEPQNWDTDHPTWDFLDHTSPPFDLTISQRDEMHRFLDDQGIDPERFVCLHVRDAGFRIKKEGRHSYRNVELDSFNLAVEELLADDFSIIRMGSPLSTPLTSPRSGLIDYAHLPTRSATLDLALGASCTLCISTGSGFDNIPLVFRRPMLYVEHAPWAHLVLFTRRSVVRPRHLVDATTGATLSITEAVQRGVFAAQHGDIFAAARVRIDPAMPEEIAVSVREALGLHLDSTTLTAQEMAKQIEAKRLLTLAGAGLGRPAHVCTVGTISPSFLRSHPEWAS